MVEDSRFNQKYRQKNRVASGPEERRMEGAFMEQKIVEVASENVMFVKLLDGIIDIKATPPSPFQQRKGVLPSRSTR